MIANFNINKTRKVTIYFVIASLLFFFSSVGFLAAHITELYDEPVFRLIDRVGNKVARVWEAIFIGSDSDLPDELRFSSIFTSLHGKTVKIGPPERDGNGGAVTSWGKFIVLITHEGKIYFVDPNLTATLSNIEPPFNGFEDYQIDATQPPFDKVEHNFRKFRYNDISYFRSDGRQGLLISYTKYNGKKKCYTNTISRLHVEISTDKLLDFEATEDQWIDIYHSKPCLPLKHRYKAIEVHMAGGRIIFDGDRTVYLSNGDYHWDGIRGPRTIPEADPENSPAVAQDPASDYGKVVAIDVVTGRAHQLSRGHRNPQGIALDRSRNVWVVEHGPRGGDELNLIENGKNYGWPLESLGTRYSGLPLQAAMSAGRHERFTRPMLAWLPSIGISGLTRVEGFHESWDGDLLASSLNGSKLIRLRVAEKRVIFSEFIEIGLRIRHVHQHGDGRIVLWTDKGYLIFISPAAGGAGLEYANYRMEKMKAKEGASDELVNKVRVAIESCLECHSLDVGENAKAPSLAEIYDVEIGSTSFQGYSESLISDKRVWTRDLLAKYLSDPQSTLPNTNMPSPNITDEKVLQAVINIIEGLKTDNDERHQLQ